MDYMFKIDDFKGPLDLLLHLIKKSDIDIYDIKIEIITKQYLDFIKKMEEMNLTIASEYLIMAAELIEMKSKMLLPKSKNENDDLYEEDPRESLIRRLIEYKKYKEVTNDFKCFEKNRQYIHTKHREDLRKYAENDSKIILEDELELNDLINAFNEFIKRKNFEKPLNTKITKKEISVKDRTKKIRNILKGKKKVEFFELFEVLTKEYVVVTFLSILDMSKKKEIKIKQDNNFEKIYIINENIGDKNE